MAARKTAKKNTNSNPPIRREVWGIICLVLALVSLLGFFVKDYWLVDGLCLYVFKGLFGWGYYLFPAVFLCAALILLNHHGRPVTARLVCLFCMPMVLGAILHLFLSVDGYGYDWISIRSLYRGGINLETGGAISGIIANLLTEAVSVYGAAPILFIVFIALGFVAGCVSLKAVWTDFRNRKRNPYVVKEKAKAQTTQKAQKTVAPVVPEQVTPRPLPESEIFQMDDGAEEKKKTTKTEKKKRLSSIVDTPLNLFGKNTVEEEVEEESVETEDIPPMPKGAIFLNRNDPKLQEYYSTNRVTNPAPESPFVEDDTLQNIPVEVEHKSEGFDEHFAPAPVAENTPKKPAKVKIAKEEIEKEVQSINTAVESETNEDQYIFPPVKLLTKGKAAQTDGKSEIQTRKELLEDALHSFGIHACVSDITPGPTVTRYDLELEAGVKLNKLTNLANDLALSLGVVSVRIAPVPDKISTVGVEVPNKTVTTVYLRDIIESENFKKAASKLTFAIGKDIGGNAIVGNIAKLPHLLIAGTTGSGKSVCINSLILSILYKSTPKEVRFIMIDPKMVELGVYNGIPHLYVPVVTDPKKAAGALQWAVVEMMKRYQRFSDVGVRDLAGFNAYKLSHEEETMPNVVVVIDELADLMMTAAKEVEDSICRVAQMGRAAGVHLVIATQRPSADVITGLMKANIPSRIAFAVSSAINSNIILDQSGAEKLIGCGDMLYAPLGCGKPMRVQGAYVSDEEREKVIDYIKDGTEVNYDDNILKEIEKAASSGKDKSSKNDGPIEAEDDDNPFAGCDALLVDAVDVILDVKQASTSMLQRRLKLGYSRASRIMDEMEELGIIGPPNGSKPREILVTKESWQEWKMSKNTPMEQLVEDSKDDYENEEAEIDYFQ